MMQVCASSTGKGSMKTLRTAGLAGDALVGMAEVDEGLDESPGFRKTPQEESWTFLVVSCLR